MANILIVDDDIGIRTHLAAGVRELGHEAEVTADATEALAVMDRGTFDVVLSDIRMAGMDGLALLRELRRRHPGAGVVLMTAYATVPDAVEAIRSGAYDYLVKPFSFEQVALVLGRLLELQTLRHENRALRQAVEIPLPLESCNPTMQQLLASARRAAVSNVPILLTGERGAGKNVMAAAIHRWSPRGSGPFVTIPCATLADHRLESELFGHVRGAFAGAWRDTPGLLEAAERGTALLDDVDELPPELLQSDDAKFLRSIADRKVYNVVQLIYRAKHYEGHSKDYEFSRISMQEHWDAGYTYAVRTLRHPEALRRPSDATGVSTFDVGVDGRE